SPVSGRLEVVNGGTVVVANATYPTFVDLGVESNIQYGPDVQQIQQAEYGNLTLAGAGSKTFAAGETTVYGNLTASDGIGIRGAGNNSSEIVLYGDLVVNGEPAETPDDVRVAIALRNSGLQTLDFNGSLELHELTAGPETQVVFGAENSVTLVLGSNAGGGLVLSTGSALHLGANTLQLTGSAALNPGGEQGVIHVNNGTVDITSSASEDSNLFVDAEENTIFLLRSELTGGATFIVQSPVQITDGLKVADGPFNAN